MKPTKTTKTSFETEFVVGQTIIVLSKSGNEVRHVNIKRISVEFDEGEPCMSISGTNYRYHDHDWHFFSCEDISKAKDKMVEIQFTNIKNKG